MTIAMTVTLMTTTHMICSLRAASTPLPIPPPLVVVAQVSRKLKARRVRIILRPPITRLPLLVSGPEDSTAHRVRTILRPPISRNPHRAGDSTAHQVHILRPVIARLPRLVSLPVPTMTIILITRTQPICEE
ncbi:hypothetical protein BDV10DRAFT_164718 [Aspergillus recurvatus]